MADSVITEPNGAAITLAGWQRIITKLTKQSKGLAAVSLDDYEKSGTNPSVVAGGIYEINGTYYQVDTDTQITGLSSSNTKYYIYSTSGTWSSSTTAPVWDEERNGWYLSTDTSARCFFVLATDSSSNYDGGDKIADSGFVADYYTGTDKEYEDYPIGSYLLVNVGADQYDRNDHKILYKSTQDYMFSDTGTSANRLAGRWAARGYDGGGASYNVQLFQRVY